MIDPLHEDLLGRVGAPGRGFLLWMRGVISPIGLDRLTGAVFRGRSAADRTWGRAAYQSGRSIFAKLQESLVADSFTKRDVTSSRTIQYQKTPVVVISSGQKIRRDSEWEAKVCREWNPNCTKEEKRPVPLLGDMLTLDTLGIATGSHPPHVKLGRLGYCGRGAP